MAEGADASLADALHRWAEELRPEVERRALSAEVIERLRALKERLQGHDD